MLLWLALMLGLLVLQFAALVDLAELRLRDARVLILVGASLASAPFQFGILSGQLSLPAISLCIIAFWCASRNREALAGILLGLACALKPQIGVAFVAYYVLTRRWAVSGLAIGRAGGDAGLPHRLVRRLDAKHRAHDADRGGQRLRLGQ
jgi:hypothetical protein